MAMARDLAGKKNHVLAVIGDGSLTGGLAFEGLNQAGDMGRRLIVVLNDNEMSISHNVGALSLFLSRNMERGWARRVRREVKDWLKSIPGIGDEMAEYAHRTHRSLKTVFTPGMLFEALRFNYIGPVNGHNIEEVERHLRMAASIDDQPVLLHVLTRKGKGYPPRRGSAFQIPRAGQVRRRHRPDAAQTRRSSADLYRHFRRNALPARQRGRPHRGRDRRHVQRHGNRDISNHVFPPASRTWASANSTPSPSRQASPRKATVPLWRSTPPSPSVPMTRSYTMCAFRSCP